MARNGYAGLSTRHRRFLEVNPRFWGSLALGVEAGVDFPLLYYRCCLGESVGPVRQRNGVKVRFFPGDFVSLLEYARLPGNGVGYFTRGVWDLLKFGLRDGLFSLSDPVPGLIHFAGGVFSRHARA
jgi:predicted ATP-grasp superfamily ATP-dependent carboligase